MIQITSMIGFLKLFVSFQNETQKTFIFQNEINRGNY